MGAAEKESGRRQYHSFELQGTLEIENGSQLYCASCGLSILGFYVASRNNRHEIRMKETPHPMHLTLPRIVPALSICLASLSSLASAQDFQGTIEVPSADRWNYGFNQTPGTRTIASAFGYTGTLYEFDDRDGLITIAFDTSQLVPTGAGEERYLINSIEFEITLLCIDFRIFSICAM